MQRIHSSHGKKDYKNAIDRYSFGMPSSAEFNNTLAESSCYDESLKQFGSGLISVCLIYHGYNNDANIFSVIFNYTNYNHLHTFTIIRAKYDFYNRNIYRLRS